MIMFRIANICQVELDAEDKLQVVVTAISILAIIISMVYLPGISSIFCLHLKVPCVMEGENTAIVFKSINNKMS